MSKMLFADLLVVKDGLIKGPFGGDIKKSLFVPKGKDTLKVYEQGVVLKNDINHGTYYISKEHFESKLKRFEVKTGDLLMTGAGTLGELITVPENAPKGVINQALLRIRLNQNVISTAFFKYYFKYYIKAIISKINGDSVIPNLPPLPLIRNTEVDIPDTSYQNKISSVLSALDSKIELNNRINAELEAMAKTIYDYWFVQFEFPIEAALAAKMGDPNLIGKPYKTSGGTLVWNEELKREIPEGWEVKELGKVLRTELGGTPSTKNKEFWNGDFPWLNSGEIANFPIIDSELKITEAGIKNSATTLMPKGTCVLSITRHLRPSILGVDSCANQSVVGIFESEKIKNSFIYPYLVNDIPRLMTLRSGAQQPHINKGTVDESKLIAPSDNVLDKYYSLVDSYYDKILNNTFQNKQLSELRDWLLPMLMNGQVKAA